MDKTLLKQVVKRMNVLTTDIKVEGYTEQEVEQVVQQLIEDGVARKSKGISFGRNALGATGSPKEQEGYSVDEYKLKNLYRIDRMGNEV
jgi:hypothetical protein